MRCVCRQTQEQRMHCVCCRWLVPKCTAAAAAAEATFVVCTASGSSSHSTRHYHHHPHSRGSGFEMCNANVCFASCDDCGFYSAVVVVVATYTTPTRLCGPCARHYHQTICLTNKRAFKINWGFAGLHLPSSVLSRLCLNSHNNNDREDNTLGIK